MSVARKKNEDVDLGRFEGFLIYVIEQDKIGKILFVCRGGILRFDDIVGDLTNARDLKTNGRIGKIRKKDDLLQLITTGKLVAPRFDIGFCLVKSVKRNKPVLVIDEGDRSFSSLALLLFAFKKTEQTVFLLSSVVHNNIIIAYSFGEIKGDFPSLSEENTILGAFSPKKP